jgi:signal transduction histidine kinase
MESLAESKIRILIVDDEDIVRQLFAETLGQTYECVTASNVQEALDLLATQDFAVAISDVQMPGLSGIELLRKIVADFPKTAVIMVSGVGRTQRVRDALRLGAFDYLIKPCDLDTLLLAVERALERRKLLQEAEHYKVDLERRNEELAMQRAELERLQTQLVHNEKMASLGQLAGGVAHELNNPVGFLYSNMQSLVEYIGSLKRLLEVYDRVPLSAETETELKFLKEQIRYEYLLDDLLGTIADCEEGAQRIRDIVLNLRTFSRLDEAEVKKIDIHAGIDSTIRLLSQYYSSNHITLKRNYGDLPLVNCYAGQLNQVWMNLLTNAAQAIGNGPGEVRIATDVKDEKVSVTISDTGKGIDQEHLRKIFDPFFTTKPVGEGTGLGLSITYGIIERHGGTIEVESTPGKGTTFVTVIPLNAKLQMAK